MTVAPDRTAAHLPGMSEQQRTPFSLAPAGLGPQGLLNRAASELRYEHGPDGTAPDPRMVAAAAWLDSEARLKGMFDSHALDFATAVLHDLALRRRAAEAADQPGLRPVA